MSQPKEKAVILGAPWSTPTVFARGRLERIASLVDLLVPAPIATDDVFKHPDELAESTVIFGTWGMPNPAELSRATPRLKAIFYAAGSVKYFAEPFLQRGVRVVSGWRANAVPVAEFTLAQILLANKGYYRNMAACATYTDRDSVFRGRGNFERNVALLGLGAIGKLVVQLLKPFALNVHAYDAFAPDAAFAELGINRLKSIDEAFKIGDVVSNHIADVPATRGLLRGEHFRSMPKDATFINTGRGATVVEPEMIAALRDRPDLIALLDVTWPEPPEPGSELYTQPNVRLTSHIAGAIGDECVRMVDYVLGDFDRFTRGQPMQHEVTLKDLPNMA